LKHGELAGGLGEIDGLKCQQETFVQVVLVLDDASDIGAEDHGILRITGRVFLEELDGFLLGRCPSELGRNRHALQTGKSIQTMTPSRSLILTLNIEFVIFFGQGV
jgi:hypothetical protein